MNKLHKNKGDSGQQCPFIHPSTNKSPLRRNNIASPINPSKSPIRHRTPTKNVSPIKAHHLLPNTFRFIPNVSPLKQRKGELQNDSQFSNGKNLKYINNYIPDKHYQTTKKDRHGEFNKKSDRGVPEDNRLFSKLVGKLHSEKYAEPKSNQSSYKANVLGDNSDSKNRMKLTAPKADKIFKNLINQVKTGETKTEIKPPSLRKSRDKKTFQESQNYNCLIYKTNSKPKPDEPYIEESQLPKQPEVLIKARKKSSKCSQKWAREVCNQNEDYTDFNILMQKIEQGYEVIHHPTMEDSVKMSSRVQNSLSMDPFL